MYRQDEYYAVPLFHAWCFYCSQRHITTKNKRAGCAFRSIRSNIESIQYALWINGNLILLKRKRICKIVLDIISRSLLHIYSLHFLWNLACPIPLFNLVLITHIATSQQNHSSIKRTKGEIFKVYKEKQYHECLYTVKKLYKIDKSNAFLAYSTLDDEVLFYFLFILSSLHWSWILYLKMREAVDYINIFFSCAYSV